MTRSSAKPDGRVIEVSESTYQRFEEERKRTKTDSVPEMTPDLFVDALLDTREAVERGYYDEQ